MLGWNEDEIANKPVSGNKKYMLATLDDASRYAKTYYLAHKIEAEDDLEKFIKHVRNLVVFNANLFCVREDNAK